MMKTLGKKTVKAANNTAADTAADTAANTAANELETFDALFKENREDESIGTAHEQFNFSPMNESVFNDAFGNGLLENDLGTDLEQDLGQDREQGLEQDQKQDRKQVETVFNKQEPSKVLVSTNATMVAGTTTASPILLSATLVFNNRANGKDKENSKEKENGKGTSNSKEIVEEVEAFEEAEKTLLLWWKTARTSWTTPTSSSSNGYYSFKDENESIRIVNCLKEREMISIHKILSNPLTLILTKGEKTLLDNALENLELIHWWKIAHTKWMDMSGTGQGSGSYPCQDTHEATRVLEILQLRGALSKTKRTLGDRIPLNSLEKNKVIDFFERVLKTHSTHSNSHNNKLQKRSIQF